MTKIKRGNALGPKFSPREFFLGNPLTNGRTPNGDEIPSKGFDAENSKFLYEKYFSCSKVSATKLFEFWNIEIDDNNVIDILDELQVPQHMSN